MKQNTLFNEEFYKKKKPKYEKYYTDTLIMYLSGSWFKCFSLDAKIINNFFGLKIYNENNDIFCGFPAYMLGKVCNKLRKENINYLIVILSTDIQDFITFNGDIENNRYNLVLNLIRNDSSVKKVNDIIENIENFKKEINTSGLIEKNNVFKYTNNKSRKKNKKESDRENIVEIGDTVTIRNLKNRNIVETYTIVPTYRNEVPKGAVTLKSGYRYIKYKSEIINDNDVEKGEILSESPFAKVLIGKRKSTAVKFKELDGNIEYYYILNIQKSDIIQNQ